MKSVTDELATVLQNVALLPVGTFTLRVLGGPDAGSLLELDGSQPARLLIGQSPACDLALHDRKVSRRHAAVELVGSRLKLSDLGSKNGTLVDHVAIVEAWLTGGERLCIGDTQIQVDRHEHGDNPEVPFATAFGRLLGESREMRRLYPLCAKLAASKLPVVIEGETGTGKEVLAESLHEEGPRAGAAFVVFDCAAAASSSVERELFSAFELAHGGTLLIDEIGELDAALQPKLLRAIERGEVRHPDGQRALRVDVRVIAATRRDLDREVSEGRFRDDLYHRLAALRVELPPLRARGGDVTVLARHFWRASGGEGEPSAELLDRLRAWHWPGNVRELEHAVARAVALGDEPVPLEASSIAGGGDFIGGLVDARLPFAQARRAVIDEFERRYIEQVLADHGGNISRAAAASGIARRHFQRLRARQS